MSIATDLTRLQTAKADLKTAIEGKGVTVPSATKIDGYADLVESIETGGGEIESGTFTPASNGKQVSINVSKAPTHFLLRTDVDNITDTNNTWKEYGNVYLSPTDGGFDFMRYGASNNTAQRRTANYYSYSNGAFTINSYAEVVAGVTYEWFSF